MTDILRLYSGAHSAGHRDGAFATQSLTSARQGSLDGRRPLAARRKNKEAEIIALERYDLSTLPSRIRSTARSPRNGDGIGRIGTGAFAALDRPLCRDQVKRRLDQSRIRRAGVLRDELETGGPGGLR